MLDHHTSISNSTRQFMVGYNDDQLGAGEEGEEEEAGAGEEGACLDPKRSEYDNMLLQTAVEDFEKNFKEESAAR